MRTILAACALLVTLAAALPAEAQQRKRAKPYVSSQSGSQYSSNRSDADSFASGRRGDSKDDIDARAADPGGDYANFPSWARKALGGNKDMGQ
jgi:hypothetical protein